MYESRAYDHVNDDGFAPDPVVVKGLLGMHNYSYLWLREDGRLTPEEVGDRFCDVLLAGLRAHPLPGGGTVADYLPLAYGRLCMHEFVLSGGPMRRELKIKTLDLAKRLLDYGFHPPTVYFPLLVDEALMVEPTETETKESLDAFAEAIEEILAEAETDPELAKNAPYSTPVRRLDEVRATRRPVVRQPLGVAAGAGSAGASGSRAAANGSAAETDFNDATSPADSDA